MQINVGSLAALSASSSDWFCSASRCGWIHPGVGLGLIGIMPSSPAWLAAVRATVCLA